MRAAAATKLPQYPTHDEATKYISRLSKTELKDIDAILAGHTLKVDWAPQPGPQLEAYVSRADVLLFGGQAGGGKSDLILGVAGTQHYRSIVFRRVSPSLRALIDRSRQMYNPDNDPGSLDSLNESLQRWRLNWSTPGARQVEFGSLEHEKDVLKHQGQPRDLHAFDEVTEFTEYQFRFAIGWNRTTRPRQRCRVLCASNPPTTQEGRWVIAYWAPWLDDTHPNPAQPGELRWFTTLDGKDVEIDSGAPFEHAGELIVPKSRTFIPSSIDDNVYLRSTGYKGTLQALPEPLRSILLHGNFRAAMQDDPWQVIPTAWLRAAQARHRNGVPPAIHVQQLGVDVARGGADRTVLSPRRAHWFDRQVVLPGKVTETGGKVAALALAQVGRPEFATVVVDAIGVGSSPVDFMRGVGLRVVAFVASGKANYVDRSGRLHFANLKAWAAWCLREALDPDHGSEIALPDDAELASDLLGYRFGVGVNGIRLVPKDETHVRSPDKGDSLLLAAAPLTAPQVSGETAVVSGLNDEGESLITALDAPWGMNR